jgi:hypothetical protein
MFAGFDIPVENALVMRVGQGSGKGFADPANGLRGVGTRERFPLAKRDRIQLRRADARTVDRSEQARSASRLRRRPVLIRDDPLQRCTRDVLHAKDAPAPFGNGGFRIDRDNVVVFEMGERPALVSGLQRDLDRDESIKGDLPGKEYPPKAPSPSSCRSSKSSTVWPTSGRRVGMVAGPPGIPLPGRVVAKAAAASSGRLPAMGRPQTPSADPARIDAIRPAISTAARAASAPLLPCAPPVRAAACSSVSQVSTPKITGMPVSIPARRMPSVAARQT